MIRDPISAITMIAPVYFDVTRRFKITRVSGDRTGDRTEPGYLASSLKPGGNDRREDNRSRAGTTAEERDFSRRAPTEAGGGRDAFYTGISKMPCFRAVEGILKNLHVKIFEMPCSRISKMPCRKKWQASWQPAGGFT